MFFSHFGPEHGVEPLKYTPCLSEQTCWGRAPGIPVTSSNTHPTAVAIITYEGTFSFEQRLFNNEPGSPGAICHLEGHVILEYLKFVGLLF